MKEGEIIDKLKSSILKSFTHELKSPINGKQEVLFIGILGSLEVVEMMIYSVAPFKNQTEILQ
jgi:hypothetical protein